MPPPGRPALEAAPRAAGPSEHLEFARAVADGLGADPRRLPYQYLYDREGSALFEGITEQPEYYLTRTEAAILEAHAATIHALAGAPTLVELGSGSSAKTRHLLRAWTSDGTTARYVPIDICARVLEAPIRGGDVG